MTREATSQGRRGGIFLASRVFFLAMFAVVALRSTTVLATMESVSGDTAVDHGGDVAHIRGRKLTQQTGPYTYSFTVNAVNYGGTIGPAPYYVKLDGVMPSVDQFTVHVAPDKNLCAAGTGGSCVAGVAGFIDGDELTQSNWEKASSTAGTLLFSITTTVRVSKIEIKHARPLYEPGWLIKENGVEVYRESTNGGSDSEPSPVTYTYDLATFTKLPERYEIHNDLTCIGRNELGEFTLSLAECAAKCEKFPTCISFDFQANPPDWASTSTYKCLLSETCTKELATTDTRYSLVVKLLSCDASTAPTNGGLGNCTDTLEIGSTCQPTCDTGYKLFGERSCTTVDAADCLLPGQPAANPTTLKLAVDACLDAVPSGEKC